MTSLRTVTYDTDTHKVVPIEPTYEMILEMTVCTMQSYDEAYPKYGKMLNAAPEFVSLSQWHDISTAPRDTEIDTWGEFKPSQSSDVIVLRFANDYISSNTPYPLDRTHFIHNGRTGKYTRTHWQPLPNSPQASADPTQQAQPDQHELHAASVDVQSGGDNLMPQHRTVAEIDGDDSFGG